MFENFRESIIKLAQEEEERRAKQGVGSSGSAVPAVSAAASASASASAKKKKKRAKFSHVSVNAERKVMFDFESSPEYPEQVSVKAGDVVFVFESFEDGWSQVKKYSGNQGVIPTAYLADIVPISGQVSSFRSKLGAHVKQRLKVLALMAIDQAKVKAASAAELTVRFARFAVTDLLIPAVTKVFLIVSRNESYTTSVSSVVRNLYEVVCGSFVHSLTQDELAWYSEELKQDLDKVKAEKARRAQLAST